MSKDPFEELFGPADADAEEPQPVPARNRLAYEQSERVQTAPLPTRRRDQLDSANTPAFGSQAPGGSDAPGDSDRGAKAKPWIIVGIVTVVALIASIVVLNIARGNDAPEAETPSTTQEITTAPTKTPTPTKKPETEKPTEKPADKAPTVDVGPTGEMNVPTWGITAQISGKFGWPNYEIRGEQLVLLGSPLINQLPDSCAAMREQWGIERTAAGGYEVFKPETTCAAAPELFDELWGLTAAMVDSVQPQ